MRSLKDGELLGLEWGMIHQVSNIIFPDENAASRCQYSKESDKNMMSYLTQKRSLNSLLDHAWWWVIISKYII